MDQEQKARELISFSQLFHQLLSKLYGVSFDFIKKTKDLLSFYRNLVEFFFFEDWLSFHD